MKAPLLFSQLWGLVFHCCGVPNSQQQWLSSLASTVAPLSAPNNIPWLVSMAETCQGILLSRWWILSTANCLIKMKHLHSDISIFINQESTLLGHKICLHPSFDPKVGTDAVKGDIGVALLQYPIRKEDVPISYTYNVLWKSCYNCQHRHCMVHQYQKHNNFGTRIKQLSVKLLDLSFCHHQHISLTKADNLCIWSQPQEDCWVQQGSPVLCPFGSHWELVGLVRESSMACYDPILAIKTAPYISWMRWIIKTSQKPLFSLPCSFSSGGENIPPEHFILDSDAATLTPHGFSIQSWKKFGTLSGNRHWNTPSVFLDSSQISRQLHLGISEISSASSLPRARSLISPTAKLWDLSDIAQYQHSTSDDTSGIRSWIYSVPDKIETEIHIQLNREVNHSPESQTVDNVKAGDKPVTYNLQPWDPLRANKIEFWAPPMFNSDESKLSTFAHPMESWFYPILFGAEESTENTGAYWIPSKSMSLRFGTLSTQNMPLVWGKSADYTDNFWTQSKSHMIRHSSQVDRIRTLSKSEATTIKSQNEDTAWPWTYSPINVIEPLIYSNVDTIKGGTQTEYDFIQTWAQLETQTRHYLTKPKIDTISHWLQIQNEIIRPWNHLNFQITSPRTQIEARKNKYETQSEVDTVRYWTQTETIIQWSQPESGILRYLFQTKSDQVRPKIKLEFKTVHPWVHPKADAVKIWTQFEDGNFQHWTETETGTFTDLTQFTDDRVNPQIDTEPDIFRLWSQTESQTILSRSQSENDRIRSWFQIQMETVKYQKDTKFQTLYPWSPEVDRTTPCIQSEAETIQLLFYTVTVPTNSMESETKMVSFWPWSAVDSLKSWRFSEDDKPKSWIQLGSDSFTFWTQPDANIITQLSQNQPHTLWIQDDSSPIIPWTLTEEVKVGTWTLDETLRVNPWIQAIDGTGLPWIHSKFSELNQWKHDVEDTVLWTLADFSIVNMWTPSASDTFPLCMGPKMSVVSPWTQCLTNEFKLQTETKLSTLNFKTKPKADTEMLWTQDYSKLLNPWTETVADITTPWDYSDSVAMKLWTDTEDERVTPWIKSEFSSVNLWTEPIVDTLTLLTQVDSIVVNTWTQSTLAVILESMQAAYPPIYVRTQPEAEIGRLCTHMETSAVFSWVQTQPDTVTSWTQPQYPELNPWAKPEDVIDTLYTQAEPSSLVSWEQNEVDTYITWPLGVSLWKQFEDSTVKPWTQDEFLAVNHRQQSVAAITTVWTQVEFLTVSTLTQFKTDTVTPLIQDEFQSSNPWTQPVVNIAKPWTHTNFPPLNIWTGSMTTIITPWTQTLSLSLYPWTETLLDDKLWTRFIPPASNPWKQLVKVTPWIRVESPGVNPWTQVVTNIVALSTNVEIPAINFSTQHDPHNITSWNNAETPALNHFGTDIVTVTMQAYPLTIKQWTQILANTVMVWTQGETLEQSFWAQPELNTFKTFVRAESVIVNTLNQPLTLTGDQPVSQEVKPWRKPAAGTITSWTPTDSTEVNIWAQMEVAKGTPWIPDEYLLENTWTQKNVMDTITPFTLAGSSTVNPWTQAIVYMVTQWTHHESPTFNPWIGEAANVVTLWMDVKSSAVNPWMQSDIKSVTRWDQLNSPSVNFWPEDTAYKVTLLTLPESSVVNFGANSPVEFSVVNVQAQTITGSITLWVHADSIAIKPKKSENVKGMSCTMAEPPAVNLRTLTITDVATPGPWFETPELIPKVHPESDIIKSWVLYKVLSKTLLPFLDSDTFQLPLSFQTAITQTSTQTSFPWIYPSKDIVTFWSVPQTGMTLLTIADTPWPPPEADIKRSWPQSQTDTMKTWAQPEFQILSTLTQSESERFKPLPQPDIDQIIPQMLPVPTIFHLLTQSRRDRMKSLSYSEIRDPGIQAPEFKTEVVAISRWTQHKTSIIGPLIPAKSQVAQSWTHSEADIVELLTQTPMKIANPLFLPEINTLRPSFQTQIDAIRQVSQSEFITVITLWFQAQNDAIRPLFQTEFQITQSWAKPKIGLTNSWVQHQADSVSTCIKYEISTALHWTHEAAILRPWTQTNTLEEKPWTQLKRYTLTKYLYYTQSYLIGPSSQPGADIIRSWDKTESEAIQTWYQPETQEMKFEALFEGSGIRPWFQIQSDTMKTWYQPQVIGLIQTDIRKVHSWIQQKSNTIQLMSHLRSQAINPSVNYWLQIQNNIWPLTLQEFQTVSLWTQPGRYEAHPWNHPRTQEIRSWTEIESQVPKSWNLPDKSGPLISSEQSFVALSTKFDATETQKRRNSLQPSQFTNIIFHTLSSVWLPRRVGYLYFSSFLQVAKTKGSLHAPSTTLSFFPTSFSFPIPCSLQSSCRLSSSCTTFMLCSFPSPCVSTLCSDISSMAFFSPVFLPLTAFSDPLHEQSSSRFSEEVNLSDTFSSLHTPLDTLLTKQLFLMPESQSGPKSQYQPEQEPLKYSELNVSLAECHLGMVWNESLQAFWLFKTAIIAHETIECGLRPGLVPHCPNCWEAEVGEFPWMVSVQLSFSHFCAGSILNEQWILTTARCANFIKNSEALALVQVGLMDLQDPVKAQTVGIHRATPYIGPKGPLGPGLILLKQPLHFQPLVLPICLEESLEQKSNIQLHDCWLPSWSLMRGSPGILQKRHVSILKVSTCAKFWPKLNEFTFCVEAKKAMGEAGCKGDLGAPLVCHLQQKDTWVQVGILSHFDEHCTKPYVFSQLSPFLPWLQRVTRLNRAPWSQQGPMTTSASISLSVSPSINASAFTSTPASIQPHFISLPQPQTLADRISLRYAMPWQAIIISCGGQICSGSIVSNSWVLTAAHCVRNMNPKDTAVILGLRHPGVPIRVVKVSTILLHERFRIINGAARNDLALILLQDVQTPVQLLAPLGHLKNLNSSECWLSGPLILKTGETDENPELLRMQVKGASSCAHLYPDIGSSIVCFITQATSGSDKNVEPVTPGSAVMCKPLSGSGSWRQIGFTSFKALATIVSPHFSWILSTSAKAGHPLNQARMSWGEMPKSCSLLKQPPAISLSSIIIIAAQFVVASDDLLIL